MATFVKYENFIEVLINEEVDLFGTTDTFNAVLVRSTDTPVAATDDQLADVVQITGTSYAAIDIQNDSTRTGGTVTVTTAAEVVWTAGAADWQEARWVAIYDDTSTADELMCYFDYGSNFTVGNGETFTLDFGANLCTLA